MRIFLVVEKLLRPDGTRNSLAPLSAIALGFDNGGIQASEQRAIRRDVDEPIGPANENLCGLSVKPGDNFLNHLAVNTSGEIRCPDWLFAGDG